MDGTEVARISPVEGGHGLLVLVGVTHDDDAAKAATLARKVWTMRILEDERSASDLGAPLLVVSQFTLMADTRKSRRPSWSAAAPRPVAEPLVDEFVAYLLEHAPALVKNRVSYGQSTGDGKPDVFYVINPEESTQGALSAAVKNAQKHDNVQICRISVPEHADVDGLLVAMDGFFTAKYGPPRSARA